MRTAEYKLNAPAGANRGVPLLWAEHIVFPIHVNLKGAADAIIA